MTGTGTVSERPRLTLQDEDKALEALRGWFGNHPEVTDPAQAIKALGLPDMSGIPEDPADWGDTHWRMAKDAGTIRDLAVFARERAAAHREITAWRARQGAQAVRR